MVGLYTYSYAEYLNRFLKAKARGEGLLYTHASVMAPRAICATVMIWGFPSFTPSNCQAYDRLRLLSLFICQQA